jgi:hypothetical protein
LRVRVGTTTVSTKYTVKKAGKRAKCKRGRLIRVSKYDYPSNKTMELEPIVRSENVYKSSMNEQYMNESHQVKKPDRAIYQPPNRGPNKNSSVSSNSDIKNIEYMLNEKELSMISLNFTDKDLRPIYEDIQEKPEFILQQENSLIFAAKHIIDCQLHFPLETERLQLQSVT